MKLYVLVLGFQDSVNISPLGAGPHQVADYLMLPSSEPERNVTRPGYLLSHRQ